ncbi:MAG TPA: biotin transporter BioY [Longimicrobiaceae bacterium]|nr:biotin transporter BioY [Longimicrobiaceae bacterium]
MSTLLNSLASWTRLEVAPSRTARRVIGVAVFAVATAISAKIAVPLPGTPVPFTFQPLIVLLSGALLGARLGAASQLTYLAAGAIGLPVFAAGGGLLYLLGPTGGYLMAGPLAAFVAGKLMGTSALRTLGALLAGLAVIYAGGVAWLATVADFNVAIALGLTPFVLADLVKVVLAAVITLRVRKRALGLFQG